VFIYSVDHIKRIALKIENQSSWWATFIGDAFWKGKHQSFQSQPYHDRLLKSNTILHRRKCEAKLKMCNMLS